jgi:hypothetical protein
MNFLQTKKFINKELKLYSTQGEKETMNIDNDGMLTDKVYYKEQDIVERIFELHSVKITLEKSIVDSSFGYVDIIRLSCIDGNCIQLHYYNIGNLKSSTNKLVNEYTINFLNDSEEIQRLYNALLHLQMLVKKDDRVK